MVFSQNCYSDYTEEETKTLQEQKMTLSQEVLKYKTAVIAVGSVLGLGVISSFILPCCVYMIWIRKSKEKNKKLEKQLQDEKDKAKEAEKKSDYKCIDVEMTNLHDQAGDMKKKYSENEHLQIDLTNLERIAKRVIDRIRIDNDCEGGPVQVTDEGYQNIEKVLEEVTNLLRRNVQEGESQSHR